MISDNYLCPFHQKKFPFVKVLTSHEDKDAGTTTTFLKTKAMRLPEIFGLLTFLVFRTFWTFDRRKYFENYTDFDRKNMSKLKPKHTIRHQNSLFWTVKKSIFKTETKTENVPEFLDFFEKGGTFSRKCTQVRNSYQNAWPF